MITTKRFVLLVSPFVSQPPFDTFFRNNHENMIIMKQPLKGGDPRRRKEEGVQICKLFAARINNLKIFVDLIKSSDIFIFPVQGFYSTIF
jgi:hypothetical protein